VSAAAEGEVMVAAVSIARAAPVKQNGGVSKAQIPWTLIDDLRAALDELGIDWKAGR
jgi:hypothetical protein